jgi:hypothetical protein
MTKRNYNKLLRKSKTIANRSVSYRHREENKPPSTFGGGLVNCALSSHFKNTPEYRALLNRITKN